MFYLPLCPKLCLREFLRATILPALVSVWSCPEEGAGPASGSLNKKPFRGEGELALPAASKAQPFASSAPQVVFYFVLLVTLKSQHMRVLLFKLGTIHHFEGSFPPPTSKILIWGEGGIRQKFLKAVHKPNSCQNAGNSQI